MRKQDMTDAREAEAITDEMKKRAARQAVRPEAVPEAMEIVNCRVLPMGADKISMGMHVSGVGEAHFERGEEFLVGRPIAEALEARGYAEIIAEPKVG